MKSRPVFRSIERRGSRSIAETELQRFPASQPDRGTGAAPARAGRTAALAGVLSGILLLATSAVPALRSTVEVGLAAIDTRGAREHLEFLASDRLEGRNTPTRGLDLAAGYLIEQLRAAGLEPPPGMQGYEHRFSVETLVADPICALSLHTQGREARERTFRLGEDFVPVLGSAEIEVRGRVVFAGYGITALEERYDDYRGESIHDWIALVLSHEPRQNARGRRFDGPRATRHSDMLEKARNAHEHGARALLVVSNPLHHDDPRPIGYQLPHMRSSGRGSLRPDPVPIPVVHVTLETAEAILGRSIVALQKSIDRSFRNKLVSAKTGEVKVRVAFREEPTETRNVAAYYQGSDPLQRDEVVILGAHYDHIGVQLDGVCNGADDNGSGTTALLLVAKAFGASGVSCDRSILFLFFAGEEKGLVGSRRYVEQPLLPLSRTEAMLNLDMVGRNDSRTIEVLGGRENPSLLSVARRAAASKSVGRLSLERGSAEFWHRSDHFPFHEKGIPALFFFSGLHDDYHRPSDTVEKIDTTKIAKVARLVFLAALELAGRS